MRRIDEAFEQEYLIDDQKYLEYYCHDEAEAFSIERELKYDDNLWLFERPRNYELEDRYDEDSMP